MKFLKDDKGQIMLLGYIAIILAIVLATGYEFSTLDTGESSINRENMDIFYYYHSIRDIVNKPAYWNNIPEYDNELREFANIHGYDIHFIHGNNNVEITLIDKEITIKETINH